jgi:hypothetical protein
MLQGTMSDVEELLRICAQLLREVGRSFPDRIEGQMGAIASMLFYAETPANVV